MPFKLGSNDVSKLYLGSNEITKAYLGSNVIIEPTAGLPSLAKHTGYWDAGSSTTFTDQTTNGWNGTVSVVGSGGTSSVTHVPGGTPYWQFDAPSPTSEQTYIQTAFSFGAMPDTQQWTMWGVFNVPSTAYNSVLWSEVDSGTDALGSGVSRSTNKLYHNIRNPLLPQSNLVGATNIVPGDWWLYMAVADGSSYTLYLNNILEDSSTALIPLDLFTTFYLGFKGLSSNLRNNFKLAAGGWITGNHLDATERTALYNYYNAIYSF